MADRLAKRLRLARKTAGRTQEQMARMVGVSLRTYTRWESGETTRISMNDLSSVAIATRHPLTFFIRKEDDE